MIDHPTLNRSENKKFKKCKMSNYNIMKSNTQNSSIIDCCDHCMHIYASEFIKSYYFSHISILEFFRILDRRNI